MLLVNALTVRQKEKWLELALLNRLMLPKDYYSVVDVFALLGLTRKFLALHAKNFRWCDGWCEESITFFTYSRIAPVGYRLCGKLLNGRYNGKLPAIQRRVVTAKEEERQRPIQWKVTGDSEARGNCEGGREAAADTMESYR